MNALQRMKELAREENLRMVKDRPTPQIEWSVPDAKFQQRLVPKVLSCLREGLGVEDMQANGTCTADEARQVIAWMRRNGSLSRFYEIQAGGAQ